MDLQGEGHAAEGDELPEELRGLGLGEHGALGRGEGRGAVSWNGVRREGRDGGEGYARGWEARHGAAEGLGSAAEHDERLVACVCGRDEAEDGWGEHRAPRRLLV